MKADARDPTVRRAPIAPPQRAQYALWQADPDSVAYNIPFRLLVSRPLDPQRLGRALADLARRHEALRTRFELRGGNPWQVIEGEPVIELEICSAARAPSLAEFVRPFRIDRLPPFRACLVEGVGDGCEILVDAHHVVFDGTSIKPFVEDLLDLYTGTPMRPLPWQYADAGRWLSERLRTGLAERERHWLAIFDPPPAPLELPVERPRPPLRRFIGRTVWRRLPRSQLASIRDRCRRDGASLLPFFLTAFATVLAQVSGQTDIIVGFPVSGRVVPELGPLIGMFVNTLCVRARFERGDTFGDVLPAMVAQCQEALRHQEYPFDWLVQTMAPARHFGRNPLFDALLVLQNMDVYRFRRNGIEVRSEFLLPDVAQVDVSLKLFPEPDVLVLALQYDADLFTAASASHLLERFVSLVAALTSGHDPVVMPRRSRRASVAPPLADFRF